MIHDQSILTNLLVKCGLRSIETKQSQRVVLMSDNQSAA